MAGRYIALVFLPVSAPMPDVRGVMAGLAAHDGLFDDKSCCFFGVLRHPQVMASAQDSPPGIRWFLDHDGEIFRHLEMFDPAGEEVAGWVVIDPMLRVLKSAPLSETADILSWIAALPPPDQHAETSLPAPVLMVPRVFEPEFCTELIALHVADGGERGLMANIEDGEFKPATLNEAYRRTMDFPIRDAELQRRIATRLSRRLCPEILKAFCLNPEAADGLAVVSYDGSEEGRFHAHRDNIREESRHRQIAFSINLNVGEYEGGDIRFLEFGSICHCPPTGGALAFSGSLLHEVMPVTKGRRYVLVGFFSDAEAAARAPWALTPLHAEPL